MSSRPDPGLVSMCLNLVSGSVLEMYEIMGRGSRANITRTCRALAFYGLVVCAIPAGLNNG